MENSFLEFYSRKDIQKAILNSSKNREIAVKYSSGVFGKRPDILSFENDVFELARQGVTSFHVSEEHWNNPLLLKSGMAKNELDKLRIGWDFIIDIDTKFIDYSKLTAQLLIEALKFNNIKNIGLKFSGGSGMHIGIPFESLPEVVNNTNTVLLFPDAPRIIAAYLKEVIKFKLRDKILDISTVKELSEATNKPKEELMEKNIFNPFSVIEIDTILISSRHMYRAPYSINEKKGLVSTPILIEDLPSFNLKKARIENVKSTMEFLPDVKEREASSLVIQAFDAIKKNPSLLPVEEKSKTFEIPKSPILFDYFPPCIHSIMNGVKTDGRKRALFILVNFLKNTGYQYSDIEKLLLEWNKRNYQPLPQNYINSQLSWHKRQPQNVLPPNCSNASYYQDLGIKCSKEICSNIKNPVNYAHKKFFANLRNKPKRKTPKSS